MPTCINLREQYGKRYRVAYEESYNAAYGPRANREDLWLIIVLCRYGHVYPFGGNTLAASVDGHPNVAGLVRRLPCCQVWQDGDFGELTVLFDVADFDEIAKIMRPRRRRQVSPEQKAILLARLGRGKDGSQVPTESDLTAPERVSLGLHGPEGHG